MHLYYIVYTIKYGNILNWSFRKLSNLEQFRQPVVLSNITNYFLFLPKYKITLFLSFQSTSASKTTDTYIFALKKTAKYPTVGTVFDGFEIATI